MVQRRHQAVGDKRSRLVKSQRRIGVAAHFPSRDAKLRNGPHAWACISQNRSWTCRPPTSACESSV